MEKRLRINNIKLLGRERREQRSLGDLTVKVSPAREVTWSPVGEDLAGFWKTRHSHAVSHEGALIQFQQGQIVAARQLLRLESH